MYVYSTCIYGSIRMNGGKDACLYKWKNVCTHVYTVCMYGWIEECMYLWKIACTFVYTVCMYE